MRWVVLAPFAVAIAAGVTLVAQGHPAGWIAVVLHLAGGLAVIFWDR